MFTREGIIQFLANLATLSIFTYISVWGREIGLSDPEIALAATIYGCVAFSSGILTGKLSDLFGKRKIFVIIGLISGGMAIFFQIIPRYIEFFLFRALSGIGIGMYAPALVALVSDKGDKIGNFSAYGSFGWTVGVLISGIIGMIWVPGIFIFGGLAFTGSALVSFTLTDVEKRKRYKDSLMRIIYERKEIYLALAIRHSFAAAIWTLWPLFLIELGANTFWIAIVQCTNALTQTFVMSKITDQLNSKKMVEYGLLLSFLAFFSFTIPSNFIAIIPLQIILGFSWAFLYVGTLRYSVEKSFFDKSMAAGILTSILPISNIFGSLIAFSITSTGGSYVEIILAATLATLITFFGFLFYENRILSE